MCYGQSKSEIIDELQYTLLNYNIWPYPKSVYKLKSVYVDYKAPKLTISFLGETKRIYSTDYLSNSICFDLLNSNFKKSIYTIYNDYPIEISCKSGIDVKKRETINGREFDSSNELCDSYHLTCRSEAIYNRILNALQNLQAYAKEEKVKSSRNILDDAVLSVQKVSFISPDESGKLKANQTGCIKVEIQNSEYSNAVDVSCIVQETNKSELFTYDQYTSVDRIGGNETKIINIPIKASENVDNNTYQFEVKVLYKGSLINKKNIDITASNPKKQQTVSKQQASSSKIGVPNRNKIIHMRKMNGNTYLISCKVNGLPLDFVFDTGAAHVTLSRKQAQFMLKNGYLSKSDIIGSSSYKTASGDISTGMVVKLKKIDINGLVLTNVEAAIINSDSAPLLLGQSALSKLGKIQIDFRNSTLTIIR